MAPITRAAKDAWTAAKAKYELSIEQAKVPLDDPDRAPDLELTSDEQELLFGGSRNPDIEPDWDALA